MKALCWLGKNRVAVEDVPDPKILNPRDAVIKITTTAICGSDLHLLDGFIPTMERGDILGHEFMGEVVEKGPEVKNLKIGDRVVVPFTISCGDCFFCKKQLWSLCDNSQPRARIAETMYGYSASGLFGYSHMYGGYAGGQAEYARVPFADVGPLKVPDHLQGRAGAVPLRHPPHRLHGGGELRHPAGATSSRSSAAARSASSRSSAPTCWAPSSVIAIDRIPERLQMARTKAKAEVINYEEVDVLEALKEMTGGRGPDSCIDAVGLEAHGTTLDAWYDLAKTTLMMETDRSHALRRAIQACRKGGTVSIPGVYGGLLDKFPMGAAFAKGLTLKMGQTHMHRYMKPLLDRIEKGEIDPTFIITHRLPLDEAPKAYKTFRDKQDECIKVVLKPGEGHGRKAS